MKVTIGILSLLSVACHANVTTIPLVPHHVQRQRRLEEGVLPVESNFRRRNEALEVGALYHGYGTHYIDLWCGTPPQRQTVIVDTGSGVTAFPCSACKDCGAPTYHVDNYFMEADSSTFSKVPCGQCKKGSCSGGQECRISMSYQEGSSWSAYEAIDQCYVGGPHNKALTHDKGTEDIDPEHAAAFTIPLDFGCQTRITGLFKTQLADGIMGMEDAKTSFWQQMFDAGKTGSDKKFSLCFSRPLGTEKTGTEAGAMTLGGVDGRLHASPMVFAKRSNKAGFYNVHIRNVYLRDGKGGESAKPSDPAAKVIHLDVAETNLNAGGLIVDSGTTDTYFSSVISSKFRAAYQELTGKTYNHDKQKITEDEVKAMPTILVQLEGDVDRNNKLGDADDVVGLAGTLDPDHPYDIILAIPATHYMEPDKTGAYTARFYDNERSGSVIGANSMMGHDVLFDVDNGVLGWAESECDYNKLVTDGGYTDALGDFPDQGENPVPTSPAEEPAPVSETPEAPAQETPEAPAPAPETPKPPVQPHPTGSTPKTTTKTSAAEDFKADIKQEFNKVLNACDSWYCKGGLLLSLVLVCCCGCCLGKCFCGRRGSSLPAKYERAEVEMAGSFSIDGKTYKDDPLEDEYGEFEINGNGVAT